MAENNRPSLVEPNVVLDGHRDYICSVAFLPDSKRIVSGSDDGMVHVWAANGGDAPVVSKRLENRVWAVATSPNGLWIAMGGKRFVSIYDATTYEKLHSFKSLYDCGNIYTLCFSPDSSMLLGGGSNGRLSIWTKLGERHIMPSHGAAIICARYSPLGDKIASCDVDSRLQVRYSVDGKLVFPPTTFPFSFTSLAWGLNGHWQIFAGCGDDSIRCIDSATGEVLSRWNSHIPALRSIVVSQNGKFLGSASVDGMIRFWDVATGTQIGHPLRHGSDLYSIDLSPDGMSLVSGGADQQVRVWGLKDLIPPSFAANLTAPSQLPTTTVPYYSSWGLDIIRSALPKPLNNCIQKKSPHPVKGGSFADVFKEDLEVHENLRIKVAVKVIRAHMGPDPHRMQRLFRREVEVWSGLEHPNIVPYFGFTTDFGELPAMVSPWFEHGTLTDFLGSAEGDNLSRRDKLVLVNDVALGLHYLHMRRIMHGDLSGSNIFIYARRRACIADFGQSTLLSALSRGTFVTTFQGKGTVRWAAPERLGEPPEAEEDLPIAEVMFQCDAYSFGAIMLQVLSGKIPYYYYRSSAMVLKALIEQEIPRHPGDGVVTDDQWRFLQRCWAPAGSRPTCDLIVNFTSRELEAISVPWETGNISNVNPYLGKFQDVQSKYRPNDMEATRLASVAWLAPVKGLLQTLDSMINQTWVNGKELKQLQYECIELLIITHEQGAGAPNPEQVRLVGIAESTLKSVITRIGNHLNSRAMFLSMLRGEFTATIQRCCQDTRDTIAQLQFVELPEMPTAVTPFLADSAEAIVKLAKIRWLTPAVVPLAALLTLTNQTQACRHALKYLLDRSISFLYMIQQEADTFPTPEQQELVAVAKSTFDNVVARMEKWASKCRIKLLLDQDVLMATIQESHLEVNDSIAKLQNKASSNLQTDPSFRRTEALVSVTWQAKLDANTQCDKDESIEYLSNIENSQSIISMAREQQDEGIRAVLTMIQQLLSSAPERSKGGLAKNLYHLQQSTEELPPDMHLCRGEVRRTDGHPVSGTGTMDIWEGLYLDEAKVAIKVLRSFHATPKSLQRFKREAELWRKVWEVDRGQHIQPIYGFCQNDGPFPYVVTPWPEHGTADKYVERFPEADHRALIRGIITAVNVLHTMNPPIIHGSLRGANIVIDGSRKPLLADYGFSKLTEDIAGIPFTQSAGREDSTRWMAPELCFDSGKLTTATDIYSLGMTILELMTHAVPWNLTRHTTQVIIRVANGEKPPRPGDPVVVARGLDDHLWEILQRCWDEAETRPTAVELIQAVEGSGSRISF